MVHRVTTGDNEWCKKWERMTTSGKTSDNEWERAIQRVTRNDNEWQQVVQRVTKTKNEWQRVAMSDSKWEQWYSKWKHMGHGDEGARGALAPPHFFAKSRFFYIIVKENIIIDNF